MDINFRKLKDNEYIKFHSSLREGKEQNKHGCFVTLEKPEHYTKTKNFILGDGISGFAIKDGDLIAVHKNPKKALQYGVKDIMPYLMVSAIENGANKLDCYGDFLAQSYMMYGFIPVAKMKFEIEYNPNWPVEKFGKPPVIAMLKACRSFEEILLLQENDSFVDYHKIMSKIPIFDDYEEMLKYRDDLLLTANKENLNYKQTVQLAYENDLLEGFQNEI